MTKTTEVDGWYRFAPESPVGYKLGYVPTWISRKHDRLLFTTTAGTTEEVVDAFNSANQAMNVLYQAGMKGDLAALEYLYVVAFAAIRKLNGFRVQWPDGVFDERAEVRDIAGTKLRWPVLAADGEPSDLNDLELGSSLAAELDRYGPRARHPDPQWPARTYARAAVATIMMNQAAYAELTTLDVERPEWFALLPDLPPFERGNLGPWEKTVRAVIREERPDFVENDPLWSESDNLSNILRLNPEYKPGEIREQCMKKIVRSVKTVAPARSE